MSQDYHSVLHIMKVRSCSNACKGEGKSEKVKGGEVQDGEVNTVELELSKIVVPSG